MFFVIYGIGAAIWWAWELSSWHEYEHQMDSVDFGISCLAASTVWPVVLLSIIFTRIRYHNDTP